jgi:hypothetical protein
MIVRLTPAFSKKLDIYRVRLASKAWSKSWPMLSQTEALCDVRLLPS